MERAVEEEAGRRRVEVKALDRMLQLWRIRKVRPFLHPGMRVLDIGCADGILRDTTSGLVGYVGIDPEANGVDLIRGVFPDALPEQEPFDAIVLLAVVEHVPAEGLRVFTNAVRSRLKPAGLVLITVPSPFVDRMLAVLKTLRLIEGMSLEQHYGFKSARVAELFAAPEFELVTHRKFQLGLNNLFVFRANRL